MNGFLRGSIEEVLGMPPKSELCLRLAFNYRVSEMLKCKPGIFHVPCSEWETFQKVWHLCHGIFEMRNNTICH